MVGMATHTIAAGTTITAGTNLVTLADPTQ